MDKEQPSPEAGEIQEQKPASNPTQTNKTAEKASIPSIATTLDVFLHKCEDIKSAVRFVEIADKTRTERFQEVKAELDEIKKLLAAKDGSSIFGIKKAWHTFAKLNHLIKSRESEVIEASLFLGLFSAFDAFMGNLVAVIYRKRPELYASLSRTVTVPEILQHKTFEELQDTILRDEIETLRRKSYVDQFKELENSFGVKLRVFDRWPQFVECAQRRNLFTHCDGDVSVQYLEVCEREGYKFEPKPKIGAKLGLGSDYFSSACDLVAEVAVKLAHTLWRKLFPEEIEEADKDLNSVAYNCLTTENYRLAQVYGLFAKNQKVISSDIYRRIFLVNYVIALKSDNKIEETRCALKELDWTACSLDFKLAEAVLSERVTDACGFMKKIGKSGEIVKEDSYHVWPLFRWFRTNPEFLNIYEEIYGHPFVEELQRAAADKAQLSLAAKVLPVAEPIKPDGAGV